MRDGALRCRFQHRAHLPPPTSRLLVFPRERHGDDGTYPGSKSAIIGNPTNDRDGKSAWVDVSVATIRRSRGSRDGVSQRSRVPYTEIETHRDTHAVMEVESRMENHPAILSASFSTSLTGSHRLSWQLPCRACRLVLLISRPENMNIHYPHSHVSDLYARWSFLCNGLARLCSTALIL
jgi:hypothetical protein